MLKLDKLIHIYVLISLNQIKYLQAHTNNKNTNTMSIIKIENQNEC